MSPRGATPRINFVPRKSSRLVERFFRVHIESPGVIYQIRLFIGPRRDRDVIAPGSERQRVPSRPVRDIFPRESLLIRVSVRYARGGLAERTPRLAPSAGAAARKVRDARYRRASAVYHENTNEIVTRPRLSSFLLCFSRVRHRRGIPRACGICVARDSSEPEARARSLPTQNAAPGSGALTLRLGASCSREILQPEKKFFF